jgi:hypothetical protein
MSAWLLIGGTYRLHHQGGKNQRARYKTLVFVRNVFQFLVTANIVPSLLILSTLMMEAICSSETSVPTRAICHNIPEDSIPHSHRHEKNLKSQTYLHCNPKRQI